MWCTTRFYFRAVTVFVVYKRLTDDANLTASSHSIAEIVANSDLENLRHWLIANKLSLNVAKTEFMLIGSPQMLRNVSNYQANILIDNKQIQQVNKSKALGTIIDQHLSWNPITENIIMKTYAKK